ncbi:MAG: hypothetical protein DMD89_23775 [Candidatus Rokuibacteriota bacterium]|nr:MAG: hypothetical protein DMD89_23775 [Candidatus Rokubacteria bacterium]
MEVVDRLKTFEELMAFSPSSPFCMFSYYCDNLGDHIQTLALLQHVRPALLVPRDHLTPHPDLVLLANGWLSNGRLPEPTAFRDVKYVGVHLALERRNRLDAQTVGRFGTVGCRDLATRDYLAGHDIPAVLTGCATSTFPPYDGTREGVFCVEVSDDVKETALRLFKDPVFLTHDLDPHYRWRYYPEEIDATVVREQFKRAYDHLDKYMRAELVITSRVHAALPAAAFGTPVLYTGVAEDFDDRVGVLADAGIRRIAKASELSPRDVRWRDPHHSSFLRNRFLEYLNHAIAGSPRPNGRSHTTGVCA